MHEVRLTLAEALEELPDLGYASDGGTDLVTVEGETYADGEDADVSIETLADGEIDPESHELRDGDVFEIDVETR